MMCLKSLIKYVCFLSVMVQFAACGTFQTIFPDAYPNGQPKHKGDMTPLGGNKMGPWVYYFEDGTRQAVGNYHVNKMVGLWTWYYPSGKKYKQQQFKFNYFIEPNPDGPYRKWTETGVLWIKGQFSNSQKTGLWEFWNSKGVKVLEMEFSDNEPHGFCKMWYSIPGAEGKKKVHCNFSNGKHDGSYQSWYDNGKIMCDVLMDNGEVVSARIWNPDGSAVFNAEMSIDAVSERLKRDLEYLDKMEGYIYW